MTQEKKSQKKVDYKILSSKKCTICGHPIKENVIKRTPHAKVCYNCFKISQKKVKQDIYRVEGGVKVLKKTIDRIKIQEQNKRRYLNK